MNWIEDYLKAGCPETPLDELALLAHNKDHKIRMRIAENSGTPIEVLEYLSKDENSDVRLAVATNSNSSLEMIRMLAHDTDPTVRHGLAEDPNTPCEILKVLLEDSNPYVSCRARKTMQALGLLTPEPAEPNRLYMWPGLNRQRFA
ncbi:MAG: HEAT repeat domain-containing protein [Candidatus Obscuribacterales bacterium]|nr:HEAT repeat domain-containing protein [Candidatus Obscuribacterales bacterium]